MKSKFNWLLTLMVGIAVLLGSCGSPAAPTAAPVVATPTTAPVVEPTEAPEPTAVPEATEADLDAAYGAFLQGMDGYNSILPADLQKRLADEYQPSSADVTQKTKTFLIDVREASEVEIAGHIQGAVHIPIRDLAKNLNKLPSFSNPIVVYCGNGWRCTIGMAALSALGWEEVYSLVGKSFGGWVEAGYQVSAGLPVNALPLNQAKPNLSLVAAVDKALSSLPEGYGGVDTEKLSVDLTEVSDLVLIDVRTTAEAGEQGSIEAANTLNIPLEELVSRRSSEWPAEKDTPIVFYDDVGYRSTIAMQILQTYGYTNVRSLKGGLNAWSAAGLPVTQ